MALKETGVNSILIVSGSSQFEAIVKQSVKGFITIDVRRSAAMARRSMLERDYDLIIIDLPLPDETGEELALDMAERSTASVVIVTPREVYEDVLENVSDAGILAVSKPFPKGRLDKAVRFISATQNRIKSLKAEILKKEEKIGEIRIVSRAKLLLMEKKKMTEEEAHRFIGKKAMDNGVSRKRIAEEIEEELS